MTLRGLDTLPFLLYSAETSKGSMTTPNWQHHSKKEQKRTLKPQAMRQAKARKQALKRQLEVIK